MAVTIGQAIPRREDARLVTGRGRFAGDALPGAAWLAVVRSPHAHARVRSVDLQGGIQRGGIVAWDHASLPVIERSLPDPRVEGLAYHPRPLLAAGEVRYQGEGVAAVVASTAAEAADAAEGVVVDYEPLPAASDPEHGQALGESRLGYGDVDSAFAGAPVVVRRTLRLARVTGAAIEPRAVVVEPVGEGLLVHASTQWTYGVRDAIARALGREREHVAVVAPDVGGAFGGKGLPYPEDVLVAAAATALGRPVRWVATRSEEMASSYQAHGTSFTVEVGAELDGTLRGMRAHFFHNAGAYTAALFAQAENLAGHLLSLYRVPALDVRVDFRLTNTAPARFIRGGGRPVGNLAAERVLDLLADELGIDRVEIRRRNLVRRLPHQPGLRIAGTPVVLDGSDYGSMLDAVVDSLAEDKEAGVGVGVACGVESSGIGFPEPVGMHLSTDGTLSVRLASTPQGQGHETVFAQVAAERFGWPLDRVRVLAADTRLLPSGQLTAASRSAIEIGNGTASAAVALRRRVLELAAERLEAAPEDLELDLSGIHVRGTNRGVPLIETDVVETYRAERPRSWGPNVHGARVRVDPETGSVSLLDYAIAHDVGPAINPHVVEGQVHGGLAHGLGYALFEALPYREDATLAGTTFLDYLLAAPPEVAIEPRLLHFESPSTQSAEGFRGVGEAGTIPAPAAVLSAIEAALSSCGVEARLDDLPVTPEQVIDAMRT